MATTGHLANLTVATNDVSPYVTDVTFTQGQDVLDTSTFGTTAHTYTNGLMDTKITVNGLWDKTASVGSHTVFQALIGAGSTAWVWCPEGTASGTVKHSGNLVAASYDESAEVAGLVKFTFTANVTGAVTTGTNS
jgi:hypothetical protein